MFQIGDKIVHPMHGAGVIDEIVKMKVSGVLREYYNLKLPIGGMVVMVPIDNCEEIGVRPILSADEVDGVLREIADLHVTVEPNWNRRYRENMLRLKSGQLLEVAKVVKELMLRESRRVLSTGERKMLHSAKQILISEAALSHDIPYEDAAKQLSRVLTLNNG